MKGMLYIAGSFETVERTKCGRGKSWVDNDPHFWTSPPTWGICRNDLRRKVAPKDYVFFVLPKKAKHPQMIFAWLRVAELLTHVEAFGRIDLRSKRMGNKNPNGNIIVDAFGRYNRFDVGVHRRIFEKVKERYVVGDVKDSRFLTEQQIAMLAPTFAKTLGRILGRSGRSPFEIVSRYGRQLSESQVYQLLTWLDA